MISCEKQELEPINDSRLEDISYIDFANGNNANRGISNGMLYFPSMDIFLSTVAVLENSEQLLEDSFMTQWGHLSENNLYNKEIQLGYDEHRSYIDFEEQYKGFTSLRKTVRDAENEWLGNDILADANDPDDHYVWETGMRAVLNNKAQVKIADTLYQMTRFGYIKVIDGDINKLGQIENGDAKQLSIPNIIIVGPYFGSKEGNNTQNKPSCIGAADDDRYWYPVSNRRIKGKQRLKPASYPWGSVVKSKTVHYKKKGSGWSRSRATITASILGESVNQYCNLPQNNNQSKTKYAKEVDVSISVPYYSGYEIKTKHQKLKSIHKRDATTYSNFYYD